MYIFILIISIANRLRYNAELHKNYDSMSNSTSSVSRIKPSNRKEYRLAKQLIIMNLLEMSTSVFLLLLFMNNITPDFNYIYYNLRQLFRVLKNLSQSLIPLVSLHFNPVNLNYKNTIFFKHR